MKIFRYVLLILLICNLPSIVQVGYGDASGSLLSYATFALMAVYYIINKKHRLAWPFIILAVVYFPIAGLIDVVDEEFFIINFIKYLLIIICGAELARRTSAEELCVIFMIGAASILVHSTFFPDVYGRYSGFYLDANSAGFTCLLGIALAFSFKKELYKNIFLAFFTFCGILTFSRTFFLLWVFLILISIIQNKKNVKLLGIGVGVIILFFSVVAILQVNNDRFSVFETLFTKGVVSESAEQDSRTETWALYYDKIYDSPFFGNGYLSFTSDFIHAEGAHNNYLRIIGEAGIFPFLIFTGIILYLLFKSFRTFKTEPYQALLAISIFAVNLTNHSFDSINHVTFVMLWLFFVITEKKEEPSEQLNSKVLV